MPTILSAKTGHLLVFRVLPTPGHSSMPRTEIAALLVRWLEWHDSLKARGILHYCSAIDEFGGTVRRQVGGSTPPPRANAIVGYLVVEAQDLIEATEIAKTCPGLEHGFVVDVFSSFTAIAETKSSHRTPENILGPDRLGEN